MPTGITEDTLYSSVRELGDQIRAKRLSPVALTEAYLERIDKLGDKLGAVVTVTRELALQEAKAAGREIQAGHYRGPLHGIPYAVKELLAPQALPPTPRAGPYRR